MTNEQGMKQTDTKEFARLLCDFAIEFMTEKIEGLCDIDCENSPGGCNGCIEQWLQREVI